MTEKAPCGACDVCDHCPFPDCTWDGVTRAEWDAAKAEDASARHFGESKVTAQQRAYYEANREKVAARQRAYREANREKVAARKRAYYEANREKVAAQKRAYYESHKEQIMDAQRSRRARKKGATENA